ncbi:hypothetical protein M569_15210, partial [Genlisea aurea]
AMSENIKICTHHKNRRKRILRRCFSGILIFLFLVLLAVLIIWAVLQPKRPRFTLQDATIFVLNITAPNVISVTLQVTVVTHNPNSKIGVYYDKSSVFATYRNQQITLDTVIPPIYQGADDYNVWSPFLYANNVPIAPFNGVALSQDRSAGTVPMTINLDSRVRWRVGLFVSGRYRLQVSCPTSIPVGNAGGYTAINDAGG